MSECNIKYVNALVLYICVLISLVPLPPQVRHVPRHDDGRHAPHVVSVILAPVFAS